MHVKPDSCSLTLFFSLPFKPRGTFNPFFNGHIAMALDGMLYHIVNPTLLRTDFLFSVMPVDEWLFGEGGVWVERDPRSPRYRYVHLYRRCETSRTVVYSAGISIARSVQTRIEDGIAAMEMKFRNGTGKYSFISNNCSSAIADLFADAGIVQASVINIVPSLFFRNMVRRYRDEVTVRRYDQVDSDRFSLRRFCIGLWSLNPQQRMEHMLDRLPGKDAVKKKEM